MPSAWYFFVINLLFASAVPRWTRAETTPHHIRHRRRPIEKKKPIHTVQRLPRMLVRTLSLRTQTAATAAVSSSWIDKMPYTLRMKPYNTTEKPRGGFVAIICYQENKRPQRGRRDTTHIIITGKYFIAARFTDVEGALLRAGRFGKYPRGQKLRYETRPLQSCTALSTDRSSTFPLHSFGACFGLKKIVSK